MNYEEAQAEAERLVDKTGVSVAVVGTAPTEYDLMDLATAVNKKTYICCRYLAPPHGDHPDAFFWRKLINARTDPRHVVVKAVHYQIGPEDKDIRRNWRGFHGDRYVIRFKDGREVTSTNLWCQGTIPLQFRDELPDNAEFLRNGAP